MIRIYSINAITTQDDGMFRSLKEWVQSLKNSQLKYPKAERCNVYVSLMNSVK